jgi:VIT1/CCC1 family predicted Fe2+/Mn2+ transporter
MTTITGSSNARSARDAAPARKATPVRRATSSRLSAARLNQLRASVLGVNDGIVSVAALVVGAAGATSSVNVLLVAGVAGLVSGALSMAAGEYVSVSAQRDAELTLRREHADSAPRELTSAWHAAFASLAAFFVGGLVPLLVALVVTAVAPGRALVPAVFAAVLLALVATGLLSAGASRSPARRAVVRNVLGGSLAMIVTYGVGTLVGIAI